MSAPKTFSELAQEMRQWANSTTSIDGQAVASRCAEKLEALIREQQYYLESLMATKGLTDLRIALYMLGTTR